MSTVIGVDSSTQSCKVLAVDAQSGDVISSAAAPHPDRTSVHPLVWTSALRESWQAAGADRLGGSVAAVSVAAQQHGMVALDSSRTPVYEALLWNDTRSAEDAERLREELGPERWVDAVNLVPVASFTITKLAWLARNEPDAANRIAQVVLPHDWLNGALGGEFTTDRSDASGTGYYSAVTSTYRTDLLERFFGRVPQLPRVVPSDEPAGSVQSGWGIDGALLGAGAGDNAAAALGLGVRPGEIVVSIGTSGTVFTTTPSAVPDPTGAVAGFADATGNQLPLLAMLNSARVMTATASMLDIDLSALDSLAMAADPDAGGLTFLPYLDGERSPNLPHATGSLTGLRRSNMTPQNLARASVLGVLNSLADAIDILKQSGVAPDKVLLIGGGSKSRALRQAAASIFGMPVEIPTTKEYVALGAARQAAWAASGSLPDWHRSVEAAYEPDGHWGSEARGRYIETRKNVYGL
ncbi:xylulokinase [Arthrobacter sp. FW306-07-I]|uniref:xylulokinase n=1 Tax=Arthrobacter sp. FW306-07-I TaxID=2879622 RepID=UPI001F011A57|nr:xylulokinase [Arthrobacter sp. FW306-07-I]UKA77671.1 xylulokinase [Arthrobacter sp. FW306-07-I]